MHKYSAPLSKATLSTTVGAVAIEAPGASMRRISFYELWLSSVTAPADVAILWRILRTTTANTGTSITPSPLDPADIPAVTLTKEEVTVEGGLGAELMEIAINQRATTRWVAAQGSELVIPATANAGILLRTPTVNGSPTPGGNTSVFFEE